MSKQKKSKNKKDYFDENDEAAIVRYLNEESPYKRERIFSKEIYPVLDILTEKLIRKFITNFPSGVTLDEVKIEAISHLYSRVLPKFNPENGKAYSFCTKSTINFCLQKRKDFYKHKIKKADVMEIDYRRDLTNELSERNYKEELSLFIDLWVDWYDTHMFDLYSKEKDLQIVDALLHLFRTRSSIEVFQKKNLYVLIRERSGYNTNDITPVIRKLESHFFTMYNNYRVYDKLEL